MYDEAVTEYCNILQANPGHMKSLYNLGRIYFQLGDYSKALHNFQNVLELDPRNADTWNNLGSVYEITNNYSEAITAYSKSLAINPSHEETHVNLANVQYSLFLSHPEQSMIDGIRRRLNFVLSLNPHNKKARKLLDRIQSMPS
jgi:cytochrome c-type biogenesis protein CcmH/NrfG